MEDGSTMDFIQRETGISQRGLASLIGTSQSILSRYADRTRSIPTYPLLEMVKLSTIIRTQPVAAKKPVTAEEKEWLLGEAKWCRVMAAKLQRDLNAMLVAEKQAAALMQVLHSYAAVRTLDVKRQRLVEILLYEAEKKLEKNGLLAQKKLMAKIAAFTAEAEVYEEGL